MKKKVLIPLCIVGAVAMLAGGGGFFGIMFLQKHLDKREYEKTDTKLESIMDVIAKAMTLTLLLLICL